MNRRKTNQRGNSPTHAAVVRPTGATGYDAILADVVDLLEQARRASARAVNTVMTATYWHIGRRIVESEQRGKHRAEYGSGLNSSS